MNIPVVWLTHLTPPGVDRRYCGTSYSYVYSSYITRYPYTAVFFLVLNIAIPLSPCLTFDLTAIIAYWHVIQIVHTCIQQKCAWETLHFVLHRNLLLPSTLSPFPQMRYSHILTHLIFIHTMIHVQLYACEYCTWFTILLTSYINRPLSVMM